MKRILSAEGTRAKRRAGAVVAVLAAAILLAGCTSSGSGSSGGSAGSVAENPTKQGAADSAADPATSETVLSSNRDIVTTGTVSLTVADPIAAADAATGAVERAGGRVDSSTEQPGTAGEKAGATLVLRIPAERLSTTLSTIKRLGTVNSVSLKSDDVTTRSRDVDARITALQTSVDRLLALMSSATTTADLITIESTLSARQAELDSLTAQKAALDDQVDMSTITLELHAKGTVAAPAPASFWSGLGTGWDALVATLGGVLVALGVLLPWLAVVGVVGGAVWFIVHRMRATKRARPLPGETPLP
ncbi:DUF4349 domain-containing protein [Leifsonia sp. NPDC058230]|uniref:DUF4349 domain-containing protein n=1 Tax=Leifsonia sp. NPDC058230 TaxID=3346391 RepID=UPI0036D9FFEE